ncbi:transmembrane protein, putative [Medicago truncatula]|uniref:Transmembrane protein, putative n=1 Tax=Medicago truncatula TaxID=3880 RepID=A0A072VFC3_MEDTR|nr:transmembrane protein, putative [Medicago truncatula]
MGTRYGELTTRHGELKQGVVGSLTFFTQNFIFKLSQASELLAVASCRAWLTRLSVYIHIPMKFVYGYIVINLKGSAFGLVFHRFVVLSGGHGFKCCLKLFDSNPLKNGSWWVISRLEVGSNTPTLPYYPSQTL